MSRRFDAGYAAYLTLNGAIVAFLLLPIAVVIIFALNPTPYIAFPPVGVSLRWFMKFFSSAEFMNALWLSLRVAIAVVVLSSAIGAMCALAIARGNLPGARLLTTLFLSPLMLPAILTGLALFQVFIRWLRCPTCCARRSPCCTISTTGSKRPPRCSAPRPRACFSR